jgi:hypothetical protein
VNAVGRPKIFDSGSKASGSVREIARLPPTAVLIACDGGQFEYLADIARKPGGG